MAGRKRKQNDDNEDGDTQMGRSPSDSPPMTNNSLPPHPQSRTSKRARTDAGSRAIGLPRLLEALSPDSMRHLLRSICSSHPEIGSEVMRSCPRPSMDSVTEVLDRYEARLRASFPIGSSTSDYAYNRVQSHLMELVDALNDYTPYFLPPQETQINVSLCFLDRVTSLIHRLPNWDSFEHNRHKQDAYEEITKAWAMVVREAAKKGGGIQLQISGWDQKLFKHNETSGGKMEEAVGELRTNLGWIGRYSPSSGAETVSHDTSLLRQQILNGTYSASGPVQVGLW